MSEPESLWPTIYKDWVDIPPIAGADVQAITERFSELAKEVYDELLRLLGDTEWCFWADEDGEPCPRCGRLHMTGAAPEEGA